MKNLHTQEQIDEMRKRLYDRGAKPEEVVRHQLSDTPIDVSRDWNVGRDELKNKVDLRAGMSVELNPDDSIEQNERIETEDKPKRRYRSFILLGSLFIFVAVAIISSLFLYLGGNQISSANIQVSVQGPSLTGGGEVFPLQVAVTNHNTVPIESTTLILKYPIGTRSVGDAPRNLFEERIPLEKLTPGEVRNVPVNIAIFGEENTEKTIEATIEYRVEGSNGMFYKDADPLTFRISSTPLVLRVESIKKVASGQLIDVTMTAVSNASSPLNDVLITASYPTGFTYESSDPEPVFGQNVWRIDELLPEQSKTIKLKGIVSGLTEETFVINFTAGPANPDNQFLVGSKLAEAKIDFTIERPFIDVGITIDNDNDREVVLSEGKVSSVKVDIKNTLDETVYDMVVEVVPGGNALTENSIKSDQGFYDSNTGTVRWEVSNNSSFDKILPGDTRSLEFTVIPGSVRTTTSYDLVVNVYARRVAESSALETLIGTVKAEAKYSSNISVGSQAGRNSGSFSDSGPVPPKVGQTTTYTLILVAEAGANDITDAVVETSLPLHANWNDEYEAEGAITYNSVSKKLNGKLVKSPPVKEKNFPSKSIFYPALLKSDPHRFC